MTETIIHPPRTIMEVFKMLPEGTLAEVIYNNLYMSPTPKRKHQRISLDLSTVLNAFVSPNNLGQVYSAPFDVYLDENSNAVQPDIFFISKKNLHILKDDGYVHGTPDLIIEILSPGNEKYDRVTKKHLYEKFGVKEYWIVDSDTKEVVGYELKEDGYEEFYHDKGKLHSRLLNNTFEF